MRLAYIDDMPPILNDDDDDSENAMQKEGLNEMLTSFFGDGNIDNDNDHMVDNSDDRRDDYLQRNLDDYNLKDSIKKAAKTLVFGSGASRTYKLACKLILLEIKTLFGCSNKGFTTLLK